MLLARLEGMSVLRSSLEGGFFGCFPPHTPLGAEGRRQLSAPQGNDE